MSSSTWWPTPSCAAPGEAVGTFAIESAMDELAHDLGMDPVELRLPQSSPTGSGQRRTAFASDLDAGVEHGAERFGWEPPHIAMPRTPRMASGGSAWAAPPAPFPMSACPACRRGSRSTATARRRSRARRTRWAWVPPPYSASTRPTGSACRWKWSRSDRRYQPAVRQLCRRIVADRLARRGDQRGEQQAGGRTAAPCRQRHAAGRPEGERGRICRWRLAQGSVIPPRMKASFRSCDGADVPPSA